jgi:hypothetical protein
MAAAGSGVAASGRRGEWAAGLRRRRTAAVYTASMGTDEPHGQDTAEEDTPALPAHLSALVGSLRGPADLGRNLDKYLTYADREEANGAASA